MNLLSLPTLCGGHLKSLPETGSQSLGVIGLITEVPMDVGTCVCVGGQLPITSLLLFGFVLILCCWRKTQGLVHAWQGSTTKLHPSSRPCPSLVGLCLYTTRSPTSVWYSKYPSIIKKLDFCSEKITT